MTRVWIRGESVNPWFKDATQTQTRIITKKSTPTNIVRKLLKPKTILRQLERKILLPSRREKTPAGNSWSKWHELEDRITSEHQRIFANWEFCSGENLSKMKTFNLLRFKKMEKKVYHLFPLQENILRDVFMNKNGWFTKKMKVTVQSNNKHVICFLNKDRRWELAQRLRAFTVLAENPDLAPSTHIRLTVTCNSRSRDSVGTWCTWMHTHSGTHTNK